MSYLQDIIKRLIWIHQLVDQEKWYGRLGQMKRSIEVKRTVDCTQRSSRLKHLRYSIETPFSDIQYSFHNSSSRSSHHPCLVSVLQPASPSSPFCQASFLPYSYPAAHWKEESLHPYLYSESGKFYFFQESWVPYIDPFHSLMHSEI